VSQPLLLDTHIALWLESGDRRLHRSTRAAIDAHWQNGGTVLLSAVTVWEIALLVDIGRLDLDVPVETWVGRFLDYPGLKPAPLDHQTAARSYQLHHLENRDPADRLLIATAIEIGCPLVTYDARIGRFAAQYGGRYGFAVYPAAMRS
jgi:PIN domain nuclease of toxin-antitoxin system